MVKVEDSFVSFSCHFCLFGYHHLLPKLFLADFVGLYLRYFLGAGWVAPGLVTRLGKQGLTVAVATGELMVKTEEEQIKPVLSGPNEMGTGSDLLEL